MALLSAAAFSSGVGGAPPEFSAASGFGCKLWVVPFALSGKPSTSPLVIGCSWCCQNGRAGMRAGLWHKGVRGQSVRRMDWRHPGTVGLDGRGMASGGKSARKQGYECVRHDPSSVSPSVGPRFRGHTAGWGMGRERCPNFPLKKHNESVAEGFLVCAC